MIGTNYRLTMETNRQAALSREVERWLSDALATRASERARPEASAMSVRI